MATKICNICKHEFTPESSSHNICKNCWMQKIQPQFDQGKIKPIKKEQNS